LSREMKQNSCLLVPLMKQSI